MVYNKHGTASSENKPRGATTDACVGNVELDFFGL